MEEKMERALLALVPNLVGVLDELACGVANLTRGLGWSDEERGELLTDAWDAIAEYDKIKDGEFVGTELTIGYRGRLQHLEQTAQTGGIPATNFILLLISEILVDLLDASTVQQREHEPIDLRSLRKSDPPAGEVQG